MFVSLSLLAFAAHGQSINVLHSFGDPGDGASPLGSGAVISDNALYGVTANGGASGYGTIYRMNADGSDYTVLYSFSGAADGAFPQASLTLNGSTLYGTTTRGGIGDIYYGGGTAFKMNLDGSDFAVLHSFDYNEAGNTRTGLTIGASAIYGITYGTQYYLGPNAPPTIFKMNLDGSGYTLLHSLTTNIDGAFPLGPLTLSGDNLFGTTSISGPVGGGTIFSVKTDGSGFNVLRHFGGNYEDGLQPSGALIVSGNTLYGTNRAGGVGGGYTNQYGTVFALSTDGTSFQTLHTFTSGVDGQGPSAGMVILGSTLYGTTAGSGFAQLGLGTIFQINTDGTDYHVLDSFAGVDGSAPLGDLVTDGTALYGTTYRGGDHDLGTVFSMAVPELSSSVMLAFAAPALLMRRKQRRA